MPLETRAHEGVPLGTATPPAVFHELAPSAVKDAVALASRRTLAAGGTLFREGDPAAEAFVLAEGRLKMTQLDRSGQELLVHFVEPGEMFGCVSLLGHATYPATASALVPSIALGWPAYVVQELMATHGPIAKNILAALGSRMVEFQDRFRDVATQRVEQRLARAVLRLVRASGRRTERGVVLDLRISRADLAAMTGTTVFSASRVLSAWERRGSIETRQQEIVVLRPHDLVEIAEDLPVRTPALR